MRGGPHGIFSLTSLCFTNFKFRFLNQNSPKFFSRPRVLVGSERSCARGGKLQRRRWLCRHYLACHRITSLGRNTLASLLHNPPFLFLYFFLILKTDPEQPESAALLGGGISRLIILLITSWEPFGQGSG